MISEILFGQTKDGVPVARPHYIGPTIEIPFEVQLCFWITACIAAIWWSAATGHHMPTERELCAGRGGAWAVVGDHLSWCGKTACYVDDYACLDPRSRK